MTISFRVDSDEECAFRIEVREWLEANLSDDLRGLSTRPPFNRSQEWFKTVSYTHLTLPTPPYV